MPKNSNIILRISKEDHEMFSMKAGILGISTSRLLRDSAKEVWFNQFDPNKILKLYQELEDEQRDRLLLILVEYFQRKGYPHNKLTSSQLLQEMTKISKTPSPLLDEDYLQINTVGLSVANYFHPHMVKVKCISGYRTPFEQFNDPALLKDAIKRWLELGRKPSDSGLRRILRTRDGVRSVVNFKPAIAKYFYDNYCPENGHALDPCAGYGGRLAGCIASSKNISYHGIDPHGPSSVGNMKMASFFKNRKWKLNYIFSLGCAEDIMKILPTKQYDLIFTSPPYFNTEKYSHAESQSWVKFKTYPEWRDKFLFVLAEQAKRVSKIGGYVIFNLKNYQKYAIADDFFGYCSEIGMKHIKTYKMKLVNNDFSLSKNNTWHSEPIICFQRQD